MKNFLFCLIALALFGCNTSGEKKSAPDCKVALKFINDYAEYLNSRTPASTDSTWIERNPLLTGHFKSRYKNLLDSAYKADPELGLDFDPIFNAQDFPDKGFVIVSCDTTTGFLKVKGKDWDEFVLTMHVVNADGKWLVDGSGIINIP